jgi:ABC-type transport system involved in multi-copper enzyme maturation permease subunit
VAVAGGLGYAWSQHTLVLDGENTLRLAGMLLVAGCYISVFFTLSLLISTLTHRSSTSLFVCLLVWVLWVLTIPNLAPLLARIVSPVPSSEKINAEKRAVDWETELLVARANRGGGAAYSEAVRQEKERIVQAGEAQKLRWDRFLEEATRRQTSLAQTLGRLSPAACWTYAATALTDTGLGFYESMEHAETTLQKRLNDYSSDLTKEREVTGEWRDFKGQDVPRLQIELPSAAVAFQRAADDIVLLLILNVVLFMAAFVRFIGYDPR